MPRFNVEVTVSICMIAPTWEAALASAHSIMDYSKIGEGDEQVRAVSYEIEQRKEYPRQPEEDPNTPYKICGNKFCGCDGEFDMETQACPFCGEELEVFKPEVQDHA